MKKCINILGWVLVFLTLLSLICTMFTTYHIVYIVYCGDYKTFQLLFVITMLVWAIKMFDKNELKQSILYTLGCSLIAVGTIFFMFKDVF
ncbi:MAG: hypothetical protein Q8936_09000 [Bacillota bacterium]|nr:hypothetical protein [Bacillota bacterium]